VLARLRLEELQVARLQLEGESDARRICPGYLITLEEHPRDELNQQYLVTEVVHEGAQPLPDALGGADTFTYRNRFVAVPADVPFRPERRTPRPKIYGVQTAVVTGPSGEEIHVDEFGRVKIQFHWDRQGGMDENSSCWVRVSHGWAGASWGMVYLPRIGQEVIVQFLEGDPDRPLITGRVYNGDNPHPYSLPDEKTRSTIKSDSSPGGGGSNELRFEDAAGSEEVYLHAQKDWTIATENDKNQTTGNNETASVGVDRTREVGNNEAITIGVDRTKDVGNNETVTIGADETLTIGANETRTIGSDLTMSVGANQTETVGADKTQTVASNRTETIGGSVTETIAIAQTTTVGAALTETVGAAKTVTVGAVYALSVGASMSEAVAGDQAISVGGNQAITVGGNQSTNVGDSQSILAANEVTITCGSSMVNIKSDGTITISGKDLTLKGTGDIQVNSDGNTVINASGDVEVKSSGNVKVKGSKVSLN
jgi:type VI secretion system secreted protein VgrG